MAILRTLGRLLVCLLLSAIPARAAVVTLLWDPSPNVSGYVVLYGTSPGNYTSSVDVGTATAYVLRNLPGGVHYYFAVEAYASDGTRSDPSTEVNVMVDGATDTASVADLPLTGAGRSLDAAFDVTSRRYLVVREEAGQIVGQWLDLWGAPVNGGFVIASGAERPRVAAGPGAFLVTYTLTSGPERTGRMLSAPSTMSAPIDLGPANLAAGTSRGGSVSYMPTLRSFVTAWENSGAITARVVNADLTMSPTANLTAGTSVSCSFSNPEIGWDSGLARALVGGFATGASCDSAAAVWVRPVMFDGTMLTATGGLIDAAVAGDGAPLDLRLLYTNHDNRFLVVWSATASDGTVVARERVADSTGGLSGATALPAGGLMTADPTDDSYTQNALAAPATGGFAVVSRAAPPAASTVGSLSLQFINGDGTPTGLRQDLPASGAQTYATMTLNGVTGQMLLAYMGADGHLHALTLGTRVPTVVTPMTGPSSVAAGSAATFSASASGGAAPYEYAFWRYDGTSWHLDQDFSSSSTFAWTPASNFTGQVQLQAWVRSLGNVTSIEAFTQAFVQVSAPAPVAVTVTADRPSPIAAGSTVVFTAHGSGGIGGLQYQYWQYDGASWTVARAYSTDPVFTWTPPAAGQFTFQVWARAAGSSASFDAWASTAAYTVQAPLPITLSSLTTTATTVAPGSSITWTATASGGAGPLDYQFWRYHVETATWTIAQAYSSSRTATWTPGVADVGTYTIQVWVRPHGSSADPSAFLSSATIAVQNVTLSSFTANHTFPSTAGTAVTWTASATAASGTLEYEFWVFSGTSGTWSIVRTWGSSKTAVWTPAVAGTYTLQVWVRSAGNTNLEAWLGTPSLTIQ